MNYTEALSYIHSLERFGSILGLERVAELLRRLGNPQDQLKFVHVAGTNGKGSITAMTAKILTKSGYRTGLYISPFVIDFRERMQINSEMISPEQLAQVVTEVRIHACAMEKEAQSPTEFEVVTAAALYWFAQENCDIVVLEVGLGGRFDATNVITSPLVSVIASIGLDHVDILGDTIEKIAFEKCGIIKEGGVTVSYPLQELDALGVIMEQCSEKQNRLIIPSASSVEIHRCDLTGSSVTYGGLLFDIALIGRHQIHNAITVVETVRALMKRGFAISDRAICDGVSFTTFPARMEIVGRSPLTIIDGAHNLSGILTLEDTLRTNSDYRITAIMGMLADKDVDGSLARIAPYFARILTVAPNNPRAMSAVQLAQKATRVCDVVCAYDHMSEAFEAAAAFAKQDENAMILMCGSLYMASDLRKIALDYFDGKR